MLYSALLGHPVDHSVSPQLFSILAEYAGIEYTHLKIDVPASELLPSTLVSLRNLNFVGANVTLPYKLGVLKYCDSLTETARKVGAVNTLIFTASGVHGENTDAFAALRAVESQCGLITAEDRILVVGAGGAARALVYALYQRCDNIRVLSLDLGAAKSLSEDISQSSRNPVGFEELSTSRLVDGVVWASVIANATPIGMYPKVRERIIPMNLLTEAAAKSDFRRKVFFDVVFNPYHTNLLMDALELDAKICSGMYMMIFQALEAFRLWTGAAINLAAEQLGALNASLQAILITGSRFDHPTSEIIQQ